jgi:hypothetical protein
VHKSLQLGAILFLFSLSAISAFQDSTGFQIDEERRQRPVDVHNPAGPPLMGKVKSIDLKIGEIVILVKRFPGDMSTATTVFLSKDTRLGSRNGTALTLGDLLKPGGTVSVEYYTLGAGRKKVALEISKVEASD